jgi:hypothetical protein
MTRHAYDFYPTPAWATVELLKVTGGICGRVFEPCAGDRDIADVLTDAGCEVVANDLDRSRSADLHGDARDPKFWQSVGSFDWVVTNPPFSEADRILPLAYEHAKAVAMLLRLSYLEPCGGRAAWLSEFPPDQLLVLPRISFTGDGKTDSVTCGWMIWRRMIVGRSIQVIRVLDDRQGSLLEATA